MEEENIDEEDDEKVRIVMLLSKFGKIMSLYIFGYKNCCRNEKLHAHVNNVCEELCVGYSNKLNINRNWTEYIFRKIGQKNI